MTRTRKEGAGCALPTCPASRGARAATATRPEAASRSRCSRMPPGEHDIAVRDSKDPHGPALTFTARHWRDFIAAIKANELDVS